MKVLFDTHVVLWALADDPRLKKGHCDLFSNADVELYVSSVTIWEITIKRALGKLDAPDNIQEILLKGGCRPLPVSWRHAEAVGMLPALHSDPFDRLLIAQAQVEQLRLATTDVRISEYDVTVI